MTNSSDVANSEKVLCFLTDWQTRISDGIKSNGDSIEFRFAVVVNKHCWSINEFRRDGTNYARAYASNFADLAPQFRVEANINACDGVRICKESLHNNNINFDFKPLSNGSEIENAINMASELDAAYLTDFAIHDDVRGRYFGDSSVADEE